MACRGQLLKQTLLPRNTCQWQKSWQMNFTSEKYKFFPCLFIYIVHDSLAVDSMKTVLDSKENQQFLNRLHFHDTTHHQRLRSIWTKGMIPQHVYERGRNKQVGPWSSHHLFLQLLEFIFGLEQVRSKPASNTPPMKPRAPTRGCSDAL